MTEPVSNGITHFLTSIPLSFLKGNLKNDSRYKKYHLAVEKTLQSFESIAEWADIISFLNRLSKVLPDS